MPHGVANHADEVEDKGFLISDKRAGKECLLHFQHPLIEGAKILIIFSNKNKQETKVVEDLKKKEKKKRGRNKKELNLKFISNMILSTSARNQTTTRLMRRRKKRK